MVEAGKGGRSVLRLAAAGLLLQGCAFRQWDPEGLAARPFWVVELEHTKAEGTSMAPLSGSVQVVPPTVCTAACESTLNALVAELQERGVQVVPTDGDYQLAFSKVQFQPAGVTAPVKMDLYELERGERTAYQADADMASRCKDAAGEHGSVQGPALGISAILTRAGGGPGASWTYQGSVPSALELVYRAGRVKNRWGGYDDPSPALNFGQVAGGGLMYAGGLAMLVGGIGYIVATPWGEMGRDGSRLFVAGVPFVVGGTVLGVHGKKQIRENPKPVPETGFFRTAEQTLCVGEPRRVAKTEVGTADSPPAEPTPPASGSSFELGADEPPQPTSTGPSPTLVEGAAVDFVRRFVQEAS